MDEEKKAERIIEKAATKDPGDGVQQKAVSPVEQAKQTLEELRAENSRREEILRREEDLAARHALGGDSSGPTQQPEKKDLSPKEYAEMISKGVIPKE